MKILCLHGTGLNANLMQKQLARIIAALDPSYEFVFVDGEITKPAAPAVPKEMPGPFYTYYDGLASDDLREACDLVDVIIEDEGPFDGFIGFSQGAALGVSYILDSLLRTPENGCPFHWAALFSANLAIAPDPEYLALEFALYRARCEQEDDSKGSSILPANKSVEEMLKSASLSQRARLEIIASQESRDSFAEEYLGLIKGICLLGERQGEPDMVADFDRKSAADIDGSTLPKIYHPLLELTRIMVPTIHCVGVLDHPESNRHSALIRKLCDERTAVSIEHGGGHEIPRDSQATFAVVAAIKKAIEDSRWTAPRAMI